MDNKTILYHGTNNAESIIKEGFRIGKDVQEESNYLGDNFVEGVYLSKTREPFEEGGQLEDVFDVLEVTVSVEKILKTDIKGIRELYKKFKINEFDEEGPVKLTAYLKNEGYEGLELEDEIVIFDPEKVHLK